MRRQKRRAARHRMGPGHPMRRLEHRCTAHSKQTGRRCRQPAIPGGNVCWYHGGAAPQVQASARERLAALVDPAITRLGKLIETDVQIVALGAVKDVLDRTGHKPKDLTEHTGPGGGPIQVAAVPLHQLSEEELAQLERMQNRLLAEPRRDSTGT